MNNRKNNIANIIMRIGKLEKVSVAVNDDKGKLEFYETVWAEIQADGNSRIDNIPFYAFDLSYNDIVEVERPGNVMMKIVKHGGHSTYRIRMSRGKSHSDFLARWPALEVEGCSYEGTDSEERLYAIDVPPAANIARVYGILEQCECEGLWEFEEGHYFSGKPR